MALTGLRAAAAYDAVENKAGSDGSKILSKDAPPASSSWFNIDALDLNVYGLSYHLDHERAERLHVDNEFNPGAALHYELIDGQRGITFVELGSYRDSGRNWAKFAGLGYQFKLGEHLRIGGALALLNSRTYNRGQAFLSIIPLVTYDIGRVKLNAVYFPRIEDYNEVAAFGFYIGIPLGPFSR